MKSRYDTSKRIKVCEFTVGDSVTFKVPVQERGPLDMKRVPEVIVKISNGCHKIRTQFGLLRTQYRPDELEKCSFKVVEVEGFDNDKEITLREAARKFNKRSDKVAVCKCKSGCKSKKCIAVPASIMEWTVPCTTHCHHGLCCSNKGTSNIRCT